MITINLSSVASAAIRRITTPLAGNALTTCSITLTGNRHAIVCGNIEVGLHMGYMSLWAAISVEYINEANEWHEAPFVWISTNQFEGGSNKDLQAFPLILRELVENLEAALAAEMKVKQ